MCERVWSCPDESRKLICISNSDAAWSRPPSTCPKGAWEITLFVGKTIIKMRTEKGGGNEKRKNTVSAVRTLKRHRSGEH